MQYALVDSNNIVQSFIVYDGVSAYTAPAGLSVQSVNDWIQVGQNVNTAQPAISSAALLAALAAYRYSVCNGGTTISGMAINTDETSRSDLTAAFVIASSNNAFTVQWKMSDGTWETLNATTIIAVGNAVLAFVQKCFTSEKTVAANVAQYTTVAAITAAFDTAMAS